MGPLPPQKYQDCGALSCFDDSQIIQLVIIATCSTPTLVGIRLVRLLWIPAWGVILYFALLPFGPMNTMGHVVAGLMYMTLCVLQCLGHSRLESERRTRWLDNLKLKMSVAVQRKKLMVQQSRLQEVEERIAALTHGLGTSDQGVSVASKQVLDDESAVPARTAPPPPASSGTSAAPLGRGLAVSPPEQQLDLPELPCPNKLFARLAAARQADQARLQSMASRMGSPDYGF